ncbi:MAG: YbaB/EbfC family nucleoid-associated protein [Patescibacteria group bacterium]
MFNPFKGLGDIAKLQKMQKELQNQQVTVDLNGVTVVMRGDQKVIEIKVDGISENRIVEAINEAVKKTQQQAAYQLMEMSKDQQE